MVVESKAAAHPPAAAIVLYTMYIPGVLVNKLTAPVPEFMFKPIGVAENTPPLAPGL